MLLGVSKIVKGMGINCRCHILDNSNFNVMTQIVGISRKAPVFCLHQNAQIFFSTCLNIFSNNMDNHTSTDGVMDKILHRI